MLIHNSFRKLVAVFLFLMLFSGCNFSLINNQEDVQEQDSVEGEIPALSADEVIAQNIALGTSDDMIKKVTVPELVMNPAVYIDTQVTVSARLGEAMDAQLFTLDAGENDRGLLVLSLFPIPDLDQFTEKDVLTITGVVKQYNQEEISRVIDSEVSSDMAAYEFYVSATDVVRTIGE